MSLEIVNPVHFIAHNLGAYIAIFYILKYPDEIDNVILENPLGLEEYISGSNETADYTKIYQNCLEKNLTTYVSQYNEYFTTCDIIKENNVCPDYLE